MSESERLIGPHGGYRRLKTFQIAQLISDVTVRFCDRYIDKRSRTHDQMVQAARSGAQNIGEGSQASGTSKKSEMVLTNVARSSLEELRLDYQDFLRQRRLPQWRREDPRRTELIARRCTTADAVADWARDVRHGRCGQRGPSGQRGRRGQSPARPASTPAPKSPAATSSTKSTKSTASTISPPSRSSTPSPRSSPSAVSAAPSYAEIAANGVLALLAVVRPLLDRQLAAQAAAFAKDGGFTERLSRFRRRHRGPG